MWSMRKNFWNLWEDEVMSVFSTEGKLAGFLNRVGDLIWLNVLTLICCIPLVTIGAAMAAMLQITLKMVKNEEGVITSSYFRAFRENFKQATAIWLIGGGISLFLIMDIWLLGKVNYAFVQTYKMVLFALLLFVLMFTFFSLAVSARFENTLKNTIKNGLLFCVIHIFKSILMFAVMLIPVVLVGVSLRFLSVDVLLGVSGPAFLVSIYFRDLFKDFEEEEK